MAEERPAVVGDVTMRWLEESEGEAVVFVHGIPTGPELWRHGFQKLRYGERLAADLGASLVRLDTARHFVAEDHPAPVAGAVAEVLAAAASRP